MKAKVLFKDLAPEFYTEELCHITELSNSLNDPELSIAKARVEPGVTTRLHRLKTSAERYVILSGSGIVEIGDLPAERVQAGDVVLIPPMCKQRVKNTGCEDLVFLALCTPRFRKEDYEDIEGAPEA